MANNVAVKAVKRFIDKETGKPVEPGQPLKVSAERAKKLVELGFAQKEAEEAKK